MRLAVTVADYPIYDPPHKTVERLLSQAEAAQNFDYFMDTLPTRRSTLIDWLNKNYYLGVQEGRSGLFVALDWLSNHIGLIMPNDGLLTYEPRWVGENRGVNVLLDVLTWYGDEMKVAFPQLAWVMDWDPGPLKGQLESAKQESERKVLRHKLQELLRYFHDPGSDFLRKPLLMASDAEQFFCPFQVVYSYWQVLDECGTVQFWWQRLDDPPTQSDEALRELIIEFERCEAHLKNPVVGGTKK